MEWWKNYTLKEIYYKAILHMVSPLMLIKNYVLIEREQEKIQHREVANENNV